MGEIYAKMKSTTNLQKVFIILFWKRKFDIFRISKTLGIFFSPHFALQFFKKSNFPTLDVCTYVAVHFQANCDRTHQNMEHFFYKFVLDTVFILPNYCGCLEYTTQTDNFLVYRHVRTFYSRNVQFVHIQYLAVSLSPSTRLVRSDPFAL